MNAILKDRDHPRQRSCRKGGRERTVLPGGGNSPGRVVVWRGGRWEGARWGVRGLGGLGALGSGPGCSFPICVRPLLRCPPPPGQSLLDLKPRTTVTLHQSALVTAMLCDASPQLREVYTRQCEPCSGVCGRPGLATDEPGSAGPSSRLGFISALLPGCLLLAAVGHQGCPQTDKQEHALSLEAQRGQTHLYPRSTGQHRLRGRTQRRCGAHGGRKGIFSMQ